MSGTLSKFVETSEKMKTEMRISLDRLISDYEKEVEVRGSEIVTKNIAELTMFISAIDQVSKEVKIRVLEH